MNKKQRQNSIKRAEYWLEKANTSLTKKEHHQQHQIKLLINNPKNKHFLINLLDKCFRSKKPKQTFKIVTSLVNQFGIPSFLTFSERVMLRLAKRLGPLFSIITMKIMILTIQKNTSHLILKGDLSTVISHLLKRTKEQFKVNINRVGELVLGEKEALRFLKKYSKDITNKKYDTLSIKLSSICSKIYPLSNPLSKKIIIERLSILYTLAEKHTTLITIDMEEFSHVDLATDIFTETLEKFPQLYAGIVIQAYLKNSVEHYHYLLTWAKKRIKNGGSPIRIRLVKGSNLEMEAIETSMTGLESPIYNNKIKVDANFKRLINIALKTENIEAIRIGIASHNIFDLSYAYEIATHSHVLEYIHFEMLEGIANHIARTIKKAHPKVVLYTPIATQENFINAIGYLVRRFDENTSKDNFIRHLFNLKVGSNSWKKLKKDFLNSIDIIETLEKNNTKIHAPIKEKRSTSINSTFTNEPNTDWRIKKNITWAESIKEKWCFKTSSKVIILPFLHANKKKRTFQPYKDISLPHTPLIFSVELADKKDIETLLKNARKDPKNWRKSSLSKRRKLLTKAETQLRKKRADFIGMIAAIIGKPFVESDAEVSEAIDFTKFYPISLESLEKSTKEKSTPLGTTLVITPWNFPLAIPCGGIVASLAAGNTTILKPAPEAFPIAIELAHCFWEAGIPKEVLQVAPVIDTTALTTLVKSKTINLIIFTGSTKTANYLRNSRPTLPFFAETGGKNATIVTAMADRELAIKHIMKSAFENAGQKCSATSLLVLEKELYQDKKFKNQLSDAALSVSYGSPWNFSNRMGHLVQKPKGDRLQALKKLNKGETWLVEPKIDKKNKNLVSPGIKWGVKRKSKTHMTELFIPLISVICANSLKEAIEIVNETKYGLSSGLESLDSKEQNYWIKNIKAGNLYINRETTGAIVNRQPFGGVEKSAYGPGLKAGGNYYITALVNWKEKRKGKNNTYSKEKTQSEFTKTFSKNQDIAKIRGQHNKNCFLPVGTIGFRINKENPIEAITIIIQTALITGCKLHVSSEKKLKNLKLPKNKNITYKVENEKTFVKNFSNFQRLRFCNKSSISNFIFKAATKKGIYIEYRKASTTPKLELIRYLQEQTISHTFHRYGHLGKTPEIQ